MQSSKSMVSIVVSALAVLFAGCVNTLQPVSDQTSMDGSLGVKITENRFCPENGIILRVEIANRTDKSQRLKVCDSLKISCIVDSHVSVTTCSTAYSLLDPSWGAGADTCEVYLVSGATYSYPIVLGLDRFSEDCIKSESPLGIRIILQVGEQQIESNEIKIAVPHRDD